MHCLKLFVSQRFRCMLTPAVMFEYGLISDWYISPHDIHGLLISCLAGSLCSEAW